MRKYHKPSRRLQIPTERPLCFRLTALAGIWSRQSIPIDRLSRAARKPPEKTLFYNNLPDFWPMTAWANGRTTRWRRG
jgi:hypothetical protein